MNYIYKNMQNEPNFDQSTSSIKYPESSTETKMLNEPNSNPIYAVFRPKTTITMKNEPNLNSIKAKFAINMLSWPAVRIIFSAACKAGATYVVLNHPPAKTAYRFPSSNNKLSNEPNFKNRQINVNDVPGKDYMKNDASAHRKNEPNSIPICQNIICFAPEDYYRNLSFQGCFSVLL